MESNLTLTNRNSLTLSGIKKVKTTEPNQVIANLDGSMIIITGSNMSVENLSIKEGILEISGQVNAIRYTNSHRGKFSFRNMFR